MEKEKRRELSSCRGSLPRPTLLKGTRLCRPWRAQPQAVRRQLTQKLRAGAPPLPGAQLAHSQKLLHWQQARARRPARPGPPTWSPQVEAAPLLAQAAWAEQAQSTRRSHVGCCHAGRPGRLLPCRPLPPPSRLPRPCRPEAFLPPQPSPPCAAWGRSSAASCIRASCTRTRPYRAGPASPRPAEKNKMQKKVRGLEDQDVVIDTQRGNNCCIRQPSESVRTPAKEPASFFARCCEAPPSAAVGCWTDVRGGAP